MFFTVRTNQVMFQAGENLCFFSWNFKTNDAFQFSSSFLLDLKHGIHLMMSSQSWLMWINKFVLWKKQSYRICLQNMTNYVIKMIDPHPHLLPSLAKSITQTICLEIVLKCWFSFRGLSYLNLTIQIFFLKFFYFSVFIWFRHAKLFCKHS